MTGTYKRHLLTGLAVCALAAVSQAQTRDPHIGFAYPAGGRQGTTFTALVGGQFLRNINHIHVSGDGVQATLIDHYKINRNVDKEQREALTAQLQELTQTRWAELHAAGIVKQPHPPWMKKPTPNKVKPPAKADSQAEKKNRNNEKAKPLKHPLLLDMEDKSIWELAHVRHEFFADRNKKQPNAQISEVALIKVTIAPDAVPGNRELRLQSRDELTNPLIFQVGTLPEVSELEPNDPEKSSRLPDPAPLKLPVLINGQVYPGDVDCFRFQGHRGQRLVIDVHARRLVPFLADAVPGWLQATLSLCDAQGKEIAFADDYRFSPDPILLYEIPEDGYYELQVRDSIYRGREDFVYRISISEQPFINQLFPLGGPEGTRTVATVSGWNLPQSDLVLDTEPGGPAIRQAAIFRNGTGSNPVAYAVDTLPECQEAEPNDRPQSKPSITLPCIVNGRISEPGDLDVFSFTASAGDEIVADVLARRLMSPLDSLLRLTDASGKVLQWNDDFVDKKGHLYRDMGALTHHADSHLRVTIPETGLYHVQISDAQNQGGEAYSYRLRISPPRPDFSLHLTPSSINMRAGSAVPLQVHVLPKDGFDGPIELRLIDPPAGFSLNAATIPAGCDRMRFTLTASEPSQTQAILRIEGRALIKGQTITRQATPSDDVMQAFLWRHLAPARDLMVSVRGKGRARASLADSGPVRIPAGGTAQVRVKTPKGKWFREIELRLNEPPTGISLQNQTEIPEGLAFDLKADPDAVQAGLADNLIVEIFRQVDWGQKDAKGNKALKTVSFGYLPAIPIQITTQ